MSEPTTSELLACPFCGGEAYETKSVNGSQMHYVGCASCGIAFKAMLGTKDIVASWNRRVQAREQALRHDANILLQMLLAHQENTGEFLAPDDAAIVNEIEIRLRAAEPKEPR